MDHLADQLQGLSIHNTPVTQPTPLPNVSENASVPNTPAPTVPQRPPKPVDPQIQYLDRFYGENASRWYYATDSTIGVASFDLQEAKNNLKTYLLTQKPAPKEYKLVSKPDRWWFLHDTDTTKSFPYDDDTIYNDTMSNQSIIDELKKIRSDQESKFQFYGGQRDDINDFMNQLLLTFIKKGVTDDLEKVQTTLGMLRGNAFRWADPYIKKLEAHKSHTGAGARPNAPLFADLQRDLKTTFGFTDRKEIARNELNKIQLGNNPHEFVVKFRQLANVADLGDAGKQNRLTLLIMRKNNTLDNAVDGLLEISLAMNPGSTSYFNDKPSTSSSNNSSSSNGYHAGQGPMDWSVDAARYQRNNNSTIRKCYNCGIPGHIARNCTRPKQPNRFNTPRDSNGQFRPRNFHARAGYTDNNNSDSNNELMNMFKAQQDSLSGLSNIVQGLLEHASKETDFGKR